MTESPKITLKLASTDFLLRLCFLNKRLNKVLDIRQAIYYMGDTRRRKMFVQKCKIYEKWVPFVKKELNIFNQNKFG